MTVLTKSLAAESEPRDEPFEAPYFRTDRKTWRMASANCRNCHNICSWSVLKSSRFTWGNASGGRDPLLPKQVDCQEAGAGGREAERAGYEFDVA